MRSADKQIYYRLIALWAVCEGMLGGILHGFKLPVTGLTVGSAAVIIICLIAYYVPGKGSIIKATIIVAIFKMILSPQSPLPAYFAVFFQGITGELFFSLIRLKRPSNLNNKPGEKTYKILCLAFATLALFESGIQRIVIMTVVYGAAFWKAVNDFINGLTHQETITNYSLYLAGAYVLAHIVTGIVVGFIAGGIPQRIKSWRTEFQLEASAPRDDSVIALKELSRNKLNAAGVSPNKMKWKRGLLLVWMVLLLLWIQSEYGTGTPLLSSNLILHIMIRSILIVLTWYFLLNPVITFLLKKWLKKQQAKSQHTINEIVLLIPSTQLLLHNSWQSSANKKGFRRLHRFLKIVLINSLDDIGSLSARP